MGDHIDVTISRFACNATSVTYLLQQMCDKMLKIVSTQTLEYLANNIIVRYLDR